MPGTSRVGISLPMLNQPPNDLRELAHLADEAGFDSLWDYEFFRNPFISHALNATTTSRIKLATGIATASSRTPFEMANAAADVDELSGGRAVVGTSVGGAGWTDVLNGADISHPLPRMREYIEAVRAVWDYLSTDEPFAYEGRFVKTASPAFNPWGGRALVRPRIPIYLGALKSAMLQMAGEVADGVIGYLNTPTFVDQHVRPNVAAGAAKAGRDPADVDITSLVLCSISEDRAAARRLARINVGNYVAFPISSTVVEFMGLQEDRDAVLTALMQEGPSALETATSDALLKAFAISGTPDEALEQFAEFDGRLPNIVLHTPYVPPIQGRESASAFRATVSTFARAFA
ncbi:LLM class flavin-dependent oxidoreductase [Mycolicibacterium hodleri]|uniref:LLM class flavin-dependent oxidoreductase n=1 Tax=Mycolicibacterium hodleri TaxID=49897 RepID=A0A502E411_9MYCO|nr:LLM class flavin-dependent oxidoreductase [Mycolicibacterium hodleri]TPG32445.1 LLM class flavin-dependent oxidoreductase [Mycolicibacterium hodleri]